jgi:hypothetical protein
VGEGRRDASLPTASGDVKLDEAHVAFCVGCIVSLELRKFAVEHDGLFKLSMLRHLGEVDAIHATR